MKTLKKSEVRLAMENLKGWRLEAGGGAIARWFEWKDFVAAMRFVNRVGKLAEAASHHPDMDIRWNRVKLLLTTHDAGGLTSKDMELARDVNSLPGAGGK